MKPVLGIIGGSGVYDLPELEDAKWEAIKSPWGEPSDEVRRGTLHGAEMVFLPRHGRGHRLSPSGINYRANIDVLKRAGATDLVALHACGSLVEDIHPGMFVILDQYIDRTRKREGSFFGNGLVVHVPLADPCSPRLGNLAAQAVQAEKIPHRKGGTLLVMEGPQFSTRAESRLYGSWGCDVIGMTGMPEAKLAREAELPYQGIAMATDYDSWRAGDEVDIPAILAVMQENQTNAQKLVSAIAEQLAKGRGEDVADKALTHAILTAPEARDKQLLKKNEAILARVLLEEGA